MSNLTQKKEQRQKKNDDKDGKVSYKLVNKVAYFNVWFWHMWHARLAFYLQLTSYSNSRGYRTPAGCHSWDKVPVYLKLYY